MKTNAIHILESKNISFETAEYEFNDDEIDAISMLLQIKYKTNCENLENLCSSAC
ncbi:MAG: hypothetical protein WHS65_05365 [Melioribacteraceae bacterium]